MLTELIIKNFAIIDRIEVAFGTGFNVLTGETGAGKSIIIDAVGLLLGDRARPDLIRAGEEEATVEAIFDLAERPDLRREFAEAGFKEDGEVLVRRVVTRAGRNRITLNGSLATLGQLQPLAARLVGIYGQHEHQSLQRTEAHLGLLDRFGGLEAELTAFRDLHRRAGELAGHLQRLEEAERDRQHRLDLLQFQIREIEGAGLRSGEDEELVAERLLLQNAGRLATATGGGFETLYAAEGAVCEQLSTVASDLEELAEIDPSLGDLAETIRNSLYALEDVACRLRDRAEGISFEPGRIDEVEERLALLTGLKRKYAPTIGEILAYRDQIAREFEELSDVDAARAGLRRELESTRARLGEVAAALSDRRRETARRLQQRVEAELRDLALAGARFEVRFQALAEPGARGMERAEFFLSPNVGEEPKPLSRIASGGELSRIMLALKRAAPGADEVSTLIFDEVDAGIGGAAATAVGEKLQRVAREGSQVLCITHLPQVAAFADRHFRVEKREEGGRTVTRLTTLDEESRVREMARMLGGAMITDRTLAHAREMIAQRL